jgi:hypothetical protein
VAPLFGRAADIPLVGNWNGGSRTELGTYRPDPSGVSLDFSLDVSGTGVFSVPPDRVYTFGKATDVALIGDWDGSGKDEIGTYRLSATEQALLSLDKNGDGVFDTGDVVSQTGLPGGPGPQLFVGQWKKG